MTGDRPGLCSPSNSNRRVPPPLHLNSYAFSIWGIIWLFQALGILVPLLARKPWLFTMSKSVGGCSGSAGHTC